MPLTEEESQTFVIIARQKVIADELGKLKTNISKDSPSRKTAQYIEDRIQRIETLWTQFEDNHKKIDGVLKHDTPYVAGKTFEKVQQLYYELKTILQSIPPTKSPDIEDHNVEGKTGGQSNQDASISKPKPVSRTSIPNTDISGLIRRQQAAIEGLQRAFNGTELLVKKSLEFYQIKIKTIERHWNEILHIHNQICEQKEDPSQDGYNVEQFLMFESQTEEKLIKLYEFSNQAQQQSSSNGIKTSSPNNLALPKVVLPKFDGDYTKWRQFHDLFMELVHRQSISNCQKIYFLKTSLCGEADQLIRHIAPTEANYEAAWKIIKDRFENERLLVNSVLNKLMAQPMASVESASSIRALHDTTQECLLALDGLGVDTSSWDPIIMHILLKKLDKNTHTLWEQSLQKPRTLQPLKEFLVYLETRFQSLEAIGTRTHKTNMAECHKRQGISRALTATTSTTHTCIACKGNHQLYNCQKFLELSPRDRITLIKSTKRCINCFKIGNFSFKCTSGGCRHCKRKHNTLLHLDHDNNAVATSVPVKNLLTIGTISSSTSTAPDANVTTNNQSISLTAQSNQESRGYVFLSTAMVLLTSQHGKTIECRAILDSGSQLNFITERTMKKLELTPISQILQLQGIGRATQQARKRVNIQLRSPINGYSINIEAHVLSSIISHQPSRLFDTSSWQIPANLPLADPTFNKPGLIDVLIGAELYYSLLSVGQIRLGKSLPILQNTLLGWTVAGKIDDDHNSNIVCGICSADETLEHQIEKFWQLEDHPSNERQLTAAERQCDLYFSQTTTRNDKGRFIVRLPFKEDAKSLGESKDMALRRFISLERRLANSKDLKTQYVEFMREYEQLGHMEEINIHKIDKPYYFLPHHCVVKADSSTTKLRVVFDGSAKSSTHISLNDILSTGPTIQDDVFSTLIRFRMPRYVFTADIEKMYRQILMHNEDTKYQLIWWRNSPSDSLKCYKLNTVTYGTTAAPYLAIKCLQRLAEEHRKQFPLAFKAIQSNFYVDDVMTGSDSLNTAIAIKNELQELLKSAGFKLRKWCANHQSLVKNIPVEDREIELNFDNSIEEHVKTVGLTWLPKSDDLCIKSNWVGKERITKRSAYSDIAHLFDPLGLMAPVIVTAKLFLQQLWELKLDWDAALPQEMQTSWSRFREGLKILHDIEIPRHIFSHIIPKDVQFHVFADASEKAYGAAAYVRAQGKDNVITVRLLCAKSRVAPSKNSKISHQTTIPRLELCAAKLAAELIHRLQKDLDIRRERIHLWSDSEIVLNWINASSSSTLPIFIANRVSTIQEYTVPQQWRHVSSKENPADILSRGIAPERLQNHTLWFYGPRFLHGLESIWPPKFVRKPEISHENIVLSTIENTTEQKILDRLNHGNSFKRAQRIIAYMFHYRNLIRPQEDIISTNSFLNCVDLEQSWKAIIKLIQKEEFHEDIHHLTRHSEVSKKSSLSSLTPFLDEDGIIRVGGRLESSVLSYDAKHPVLMPYSHPYTKLLLLDIHKENNHAGPQAILAFARQRYWPIKGKTIARSIVQGCVECVRARPKLLTQLMGNLPDDRVQPARPFINTGIDFCGPIWTHYKIRGKRPQKSYIAVFCCFATKACHLELVSDLTSEGFIGALKRFMARRGHCKNIYCDNATNFVGAKNQLMELRSFINSTKDQEQITALCTTKGCDFNFIPPRSPHFGGLWEAAVKSAKHLLQHTLAAASLTYEELETAVVEVEAILNSRPITPISSSPNDFAALTPGHFLIGEPLNSTIDRKATPERSSLLTRWKLVTHVKNEFWRRWSNEYLNQLQYRYKWKERCQNVEPGMMVILREDNQPSLKWPIGRIINAVKGHDGLVRVADVQTASGVYRRAIHRLAPLPIQQHSIPTDKPSSNEDETAQQRSKETAVPLIEGSQKLSKNLPENSSSERKRKHNDQEDINEPSSSKPSKERTRQVKHSIRPSLSTLLLISLLLPIILANDVKVIHFNTSAQGIHFQRQGTVSLVHNKWNLVVYYDLQPYQKEFQALENSSIILEHLCNQFSFKGLCTQVIQQLQYIKHEITEDNIVPPSKQITKKVRRGAIDIVGNIANSLFGVLDSKYAEEISQRLEGIHSNEEHLMNLLKNHTSILDSTVNIMKRTQDDVFKKHRLLETQLNQITNRINNVTDDLYQSKIRELFSSWSIYTTLIIFNIQRTQTSIADVLSDTHQGRVNHLLISPQQLKHEVVKMKNHLLPGLRIPVESEQMLQLYKLMTVQGQITSNHIIFKIELPLIGSEEFRMFKLIPIPAVINRTIITIEPSVEFLAVSAHHDQYYPVTEGELSSCTIINGDHYLCSQSHPVYRTGANMSTCEINLLNNISNLSSCEFKIIKSNSVWTKLPDLNEWIFAVTDETLLNAVCDHQTTFITLKGSGLLKLQPYCVAKHQHLTLQGQHIYSTNVRASYTRLSNDISSEIMIRLAALQTYAVNSSSYKEDLQELQQQIKLQRLELPNQIHNYNIQHTIFGSIGLLLTVAVIIFLICKHFITKYHRNASQPTPAPRTTRYTISA